MFAGSGRHARPALRHRTRLPAASACRRALPCWRAGAPAPGDRAAPVRSAARPLPPLSFTPTQPRLDDAGVVEDQQVTLAQQLGSSRNTRSTGVDAACRRAAATRCARPPDAGRSARPATRNRSHPGSGRGHRANERQNSPMPARRAADPDRPRSAPCQPAPPTAPSAAPAGGQPSPKVGSRSARWKNSACGATSTSPCTCRCATKTKPASRRSATLRDGSVGADRRHGHATARCRPVRAASSWCACTTPATTWCCVSCTSTRRTQKTFAVGARVRARGEARGGLFGLEMVHPAVQGGAGRHAAAQRADARLPEHGATAAGLLAQGRGVGAAARRPHRDCCPPASCPRG